MPSCIQGKFQGKKIYKENPIFGNFLLQFIIFSEFFSHILALHKKIVSGISEVTPLYEVGSDTVRGRSRIDRSALRCQFGDGPQQEEAAGRFPGGFRDIFWCRVRSGLGPAHRGFRGVVEDLSGSCRVPSGLRPGTFRVRSSPGRVFLRWSDHGNFPEALSYVGLV